MLFTIQSCGQNNNNITNPSTEITKENKEEEKAIHTLKEFYIAYISACDKIPQAFNTLASLKNKYLTKKLIRKLKTADLDYDPILNAQDCDESWVKTLEIKPVLGQKNVYDVCYSYDNNKNCIRLILINKNGNYLIDDIFLN